MSAPIVAVIGGGQLARMMQEEASALGIHLRALVEAADGSTGQVTPDAPVGAADDEAAVRAVVTGDGSDGPAGGPASVLTFEHEHQDSALLERLQSEGVSVQPTPQALTLARDKLAMRRMMSGAGLPQPAWAEIGGPQQESAEQMVDAIEAFASEHGWPGSAPSPPGTAGPWSSRRRVEAMTATGCCWCAAPSPCARARRPSGSPRWRAPERARATAAGPAGEAASEVRR